MKMLVYPIFSLFRIEKNFMQKFKLLASMMLISLVFATVAHAEDNFFEISFSTTQNPVRAQFAEVFEGFAEEVENRSNDSLVINLFGVGTLVNAQESAHAVKSGNVDVAPLISLEGEEIPYISLLGALPDLSTNIADAVRIGPILYSIPELKKETDFYGVPIGFSSHPPSLIISKNEPIRTPGDLQGKQMLAMVGRQALQVKKWGAVPIVMSMGDVYTGLQRNMGEAFMTGISGVKSMKLYEVANYVTILNYPNTIYMPFIMNKELFAELSENQQNIILETGDKYFGEVYQKSWENDYEEALEIFKEAGCEIYYPTPEEMLLWQEANKRGISATITNMENVGVSSEEALSFINRTYDLLEANSFNINRYVEN